MRHRTGFFKLLSGMAIILLVFTACKKQAVSPGTLEQIYREYRQAMDKGDVKRVRNLLAEPQRKELLGPDSQEKLALMKTLLPGSIKVKGAEISKEKAVLKLTGEMMGQNINGQVAFAREGEDWKITKEDWQMSLTLGGGDEEDGFSGAGARPFLKNSREAPSPFQVLTGHNGEVTNVSFTPDGAYLVSASYGDFSLRLWDVAAGQEIANFSTPNRVRDLAITPDGYSILTADVYNYISVWPFAEGKIGTPRVLIKNAGDVLAIGTDGKLAATTGFNFPLRLWNLNDGSPYKNLSTDKNLRALIFSPAGRYLVSGSNGNVFTVWDLQEESGEEYEIGKVAENSGVAAIDISQDEKYLATGHLDSSIVIFDMKDGKELQNFYVANASTWDVKFSLDGKILATAHQDSFIYLWETRSGKQLHKLAGHKGPVLTLAFSPDGTTLASGGGDRQVILWQGGATPADGIGQPPAGGKKGADTGGAKPEMMEIEGVRNLVKNPFAGQGLRFWQSEGEAEVEVDEEDNPYFSIRNGASIWQDVPLPADSAGRWALLIAWSSSERIDEDGDQTGLPYIQGYMLNSKNKQTINSHLNSQGMHQAQKKPDEWGLIAGIFQVLPETGSIRLFLQQADGKSAQNGSAARFDDPAVFLFDTEEGAREFVQTYAPDSGEE